MDIITDVDTIEALTTALNISCELYDNEMYHRELCMIRDEYVEDKVDFQTIFMARTICIALEDKRITALLDVNGAKERSEKKRLHAIRKLAIISIVYWTLRAVYAQSKKLTAKAMDYHAIYLAPEQSRYFK